VIDPDVVILADFGSEHWSRLWGIKMISLSLPLREELFVGNENDFP